MLVGKIRFAHSDLAGHENARDAIESLLGAYRMNGQIYSREWPIEVTPRRFECTVLLPERTALIKAHHHQYVREALARLPAAGLRGPVYTVAEEINGGAVCECERSGCFILYTTYLAIESPLTCGHCFLPVPLYRIPPTKDEEYYDVIQWESDYQACDTLQMNCTVLEQPAMKQMGRPESSLSRSGLAICRRIFEGTGIPTYYYLYQQRAPSLAQECKRRCPCCGGEWLLPEHWHLFDFRCDECHLLSNIAWEVRRN